MIIEKSPIRRAYVNKVVRNRGLEDKWAIFFIEQAENPRVSVEMLAKLCHMIISINDCEEE